jgi:hypothetical protein
MNKHPHSALYILGATILMGSIFWYSYKSPTHQLTQNSSREEILSVAPYRVDCDPTILDSKKAECLLIKSSGNTAWHPYKDNIIGFMYESGYDYTLRVTHSISSATENSLEHDIYTLISIEKKELANLEGKL